MGAQLPAGVNTTGNKDKLLFFNILMKQEIFENQMEDEVKCGEKKRNKDKKKKTLLMRK